MKKTFVMVFLSFTALFILLVADSPVYAHETDKVSGKDLSQLAWGGVLYDNWPEELGVKIEKTHPSYPAEGKQSGVTTWRCKECHGWDYKGRAGAYSKGSHYTGIIGIRNYARQPLTKILKTLMNDTHNFGLMISDNALFALSLFISQGQIDMDPYIDRITRKALGDYKNGARIYLTICIKCHGDDGREINFKSEKNPEYIGTLANENPWETLHKIRWGHAGSQMVSLLYLGLKEHLDVLSFCQELPTK